MRKLLLTTALLGLLLAACRTADGRRGTVAAVTATPSNTAAPATGTAVSTTPLSVASEETEAAPFLPADLGPGWTRIEANGDARCARDTPYAYWVKPGTTNKLLVYFQGGGGCWSAESCAPGSTLYDDAVTSRDDPNNRNGILDWNSPDNPFRDYHAVYIPSCTGDVHWGDNVQTYPTEDGGELTIYHRGFVNASTALNWAYENVTTPDSVFVAGCSAGSVGSILFAPYLIEHYPEAAVTQLGDSLAFVFHRPANVQEDYRAQQNFPGWIPALDQISAAELIMADFYAAVANHYPNHSFAQYNTEADRVQARYYQAVGGQSEDFPGALADSLSQIHTQAANFRSYTASGNLHCILPRPQFYELETEGVPLRDWVSDLAHDRPVDNVTCPTCQVQTEAVTETDTAEQETAALLEGTWEEVGTMPTPRSEMRGALLDGLIYVPGGWGGESVFEAYDPSDGSWQSLADLPDGRHHFMIAAYEGQLYLFGGSPANAFRPTDTAWRYHPATDTWSDLAPLPAPRMGGAAVVIDDFIYVVAGETTGNEPVSLLRYDPAADTWTELAPLNQPRQHIAAVALQGKIYALGGWWRGSGELNSMEIYDPTSDTWTTGPPMQVARGGLAAAVLDGHVFAIGGEIISGDRRTENVVEVYAPETETWATATQLPVSIHGFPLINRDGELWIIGGSDQAGAADNQGHILRYTHDS